jgi:hypothetical protein
VDSNDESRLLAVNTTQDTIQNATQSTANTTQNSVQTMVNGDLLNSCQKS